MIYSDFKDKKISRLAFGAMRLPTLSDGSIDEAETEKMVEYAIKNGVNYFDTAYPYHNGFSEIVLGKALKNYPRESFYLATKYPGHQIADEYHPEEVFEKQLSKCGVDYFDFYLLHNINENSYSVYTDERWGIVDYFIEQKKRGRIKHLGFSSHCQPELLREFLQKYGKYTEFAQIQLNYMDWELQKAEEKYNILHEYGIPVWVMEPVRGGKLAKLPEEAEKKLKELRPTESTASWAFRWLMTLPDVQVILSGMSDMNQVKDNIKTFSEEKPLSAREKKILEEIADSMKDSLPCTSCRYCTEGCPQKINIPLMITYYNELRYGKEGGMNLNIQLDAVPQGNRPSDCIGCGACAKICPQNIDIPSAMKHLADIAETLPKWSDICRRRAEAAKRIK